MRNFILLQLLAIFLILGSCTKKEITEEIANQPPTSLNGDWTLTKITGGFAGVNMNLGGTVIYNFNTTTNQLTVNNNYVGTAPVKGLPTGSYPFTLSGTSGININSSGGSYSITGNTMFIDDGVVADGFGYTFERLIDNGNPDPCINFSHATVLTTTVPTTGIVNNVVEIPLTFLVNNGCGGFGNIIQTNVGNTKTLSINAKYSGCICTLAMNAIKTTFNFIPTIVGLQIIKIAQPDGSFLTYNINVTN